MRRAINFVSCFAIHTTDVRETQALSGQISFALASAVPSCETFVCCHLSKCFFHSSIFVSLLPPRLVRNYLEVDVMAHIILLSLSKIMAEVGKKYSQQGKTPNQEDN
jgi:hypothetical protein